MLPTNFTRLLGRNSHKIKFLGVFSMPLFGYVPEGFEVNGTIREFGLNEALLKESAFVTASHFSAHKVPYWSRRGTVLGTNMYTTAYQVGYHALLLLLFFIYFCVVYKAVVCCIINYINIQNQTLPHVYMDLQSAF